MKRDCIVCIAKTKTLISCAVIAQLICVFVFAYANIQFSHDEAQMKFKIWKAASSLDLPDGTHFHDVNN